MVGPNVWDTATDNECCCILNRFCCCVVICFMDENQIEDLHESDILLNHPWDMYSFV